jgi:hypothetical protein
MKSIKLLAVLATLAIAACDVQDGQFTTESQTSTKPVAGAAAAEPVQAADVQIFEGAPARAYTTLGPLDISVNKLTAFHPTPTREAAIKRLQEAAAKLGADAVINVTVGEVVVVPLSWGARKATGVAVKF